MRQYGKQIRNSKLHGSHCGICHPSTHKRTGRRKAREEGKLEMIEQNEPTMKVYLALETYYEETRILGVFAKREDAEQCAKERHELLPEHYVEYKDNVEHYTGVAEYEVQ